MKYQQHLNECLWNKNLIVGAANSPKQADAHVNTQMLKVVTSGNDPMILFMDAVTNLTSDRSITKFIESIKLAKKTCFVVPGILHW